MLHSRPSGQQSMTPRPQRAFAVLTAALAIAALGTRPGAGQSSDAAPPVFRGGTALVPVDVRVMDKQDRPVTDLKAGDFTILEDGVPQAVAHFSTESFADGSAAASDAPGPAKEEGPEAA